MGGPEGDDVAFLGQEGVVVGLSGLGDFALAHLDGGGPLEGLGGGVEFLEAPDRALAGDAGSRVGIDAVVEFLALGVEFLFGADLGGVLGF